MAAQGPTAIRGVGNWRVKETERMLAICTELRKLGATVEEGVPPLSACLSVCQSACCPPLHSFS